MKNMITDIRNDKILMTKYNGRSYKDYALIAGFIEFGETVEQAIDREVMEEYKKLYNKIIYYIYQIYVYCCNGGSIQYGEAEKPVQKTG